MDSVRLDKWLWAARFYKTRAVSVEAVKGGKVRVNGKRVKPAYSMSLGDELLIRRGLERFEVKVLELSDKRRSAKEAVKLYQESEQSIAKREEDKELRRLNNDSLSRPTRRPTKRDRRKLSQLKDQN